MSVSILQFQPERALELILYVAKRLKDPTFRSVSKVLYFADKHHLSRYGALLSEDTYVAMKHGPIASGIYDLLKTAAGCQQSPVSAEFKRQVTDALRVEDGHRLKPLRGANLETLSASHRECLDASVKENGHLTFGRLTKKSHDAAWEQPMRTNSLS